jgi:hypothetical protein
MAMPAMMARSKTGNFCQPRSGRHGAVIWVTPGVADRIFSMVSLALFKRAVKMYVYP